MVCQWSGSRMLVGGNALVCVGLLCSLAPSIILALPLSNYPGSAHRMRSWVTGSDLMPTYMTSEFSEDNPFLKSDDFDDDTIKFHHTKDPDKLSSSFNINDLILKSILKRNTHREIPLQRKYILESALKRTNDLMNQGRKRKGDLYYETFKRSGPLNNHWRDDLYEKANSLVSKRYWKRRCNMNRITQKAFYEFLRTGRLCGMRMSHFRFGLTGKR